MLPIDVQSSSSALSLSSGGECSTDQVPMSPILEALNLTKKYWGQQTPAVNNLNLALARGKALGFLGSNRAGLHEGLFVPTKDMLCVEADGEHARLVHCRFSPAIDLALRHQYGAENVKVQILTLREIYIHLARQYRDEAGVSAIAA